MRKPVTIYLEPQMRRSAEAGDHNFIGKITAVLAHAGLDVHFADESARLSHGGGRALVHMKPPMSADTLVIRRVYAYPFWAIEASEKRWEWDVAQAPFEAGSVRGQKAERFAANWRKRMFGEAVSACDGFVYIPLQGRIRERRSFQAASPLEMIEAVLAHDTRRDVVIGMHPKERYDAADIDALEKFEHRFDRVSVVMGQMESLLPRCDYVVSQNSAAAFFGFFFGKPCAIFSKIDFHHIAANVHELGVEDALGRVPDLQPDFARYLWWFWQERSINAGRPEAEEAIAARFRRFGWM